MRRSGWVLMGLLSLGVAAAAQHVTTPTAQDYVANVGGEARIVAAGAFALDGVQLYCGKRPTVIDDNLGDYGAAYPGFLIMNTRRLAPLPRAVKLWIYAHECGHQFRGPDEETADCFGVQRGRSQRWLSAKGVEEICQFISAAKGDSVHFSGPRRCAAMRRCFREEGVR